MKLVNLIFCPTQENQWLANYKIDSQTLENYSLNTGSSFDLIVKT